MPKTRFRKTQIGLATAFAVCLSAGAGTAQEKDGLIPGSFSASLNYSPEYTGDTGAAWYTKPGVSSAPLFDLITLSAYIARQNVADSTNYSEWNLAAGVTLGGFDFSVA